MTRPWRRMSLIAQIVFFVLTCIAVAAAWGFFHLLHLPEGWILLVGCIGTAEWLIRGFRFWHTGVESALWLGGLYAFIFSLPSSGKPEAILVLAAGAAIAGWRMRNAVFGTLAVVLVVAYFAVRDWPMTALSFAMAVSLAALFAITRVWRRPSAELLFQILLLVMPVAGYVAIFENTSETWMLYVPLAALFTAVAVRRRLRVPFVASAVALTIAVIDLRNRIPLSLDIELMLAGAIALAVAAAISRALRGRDRGFVLDASEPGEWESIVAGVGPTLIHAPAAHGGGGPLKPEGGEFGGAGSSGGY